MSCNNTFFYIHFLLVYIFLFLQVAHNKHIFLPLFSGEQCGWIRRSIWFFFSLIFDGSISVFSFNYAFIMVQYRLVSGFSSHFISTFCMSTFHALTLSISAFLDPSSTCHSPSGHWMGSCLPFFLLLHLLHFWFFISSKLKV